MAATLRAVPARPALIDAGYFIQPEFLTPTRAAELREAAERLLAEPSTLHTPESVRCFELHKREPLFAELLADEDLRTLVREFLGPNALLSDLSVNQVRQHGKADIWHFDHPYNSMSTITAGGVLAIQCVLALSPFTQASGATQLIPGSNSRYRKPPPEVDDEPFDFLAEPGDLLVLPAATWHRAGVNTEPEPRTAVLLNFTESWVKPMGLSPEPSCWQPL